GADLLMRSVARPLLEDRKSYLNKLRDRNIKNTTIEQVIKLNTSILLKKVNTAVAKKAISGKSGTQKGWNYLGDATLSSYSPVNIPGVNWAIIAEMDITEVYQPIRELQFYFLASTVILVLLVLLYAVIAAQQFVKPIESLIESSLKVKAGELDTEVVFNTKDEFNEIAQVFNDMVQQLRTFSTLLEEKTQENENLLLNILPHSVVERLKKGNIEIADRLQQVTIVCIRIGGLMKITTNDTVEETVKLFDELINTLDESGEKYQLERLSILGDRYLVGCGLTKAQLDHVNRSVEFASLTLNIIKRFNQKHNINLSLQIGIHTGSVMAGIVGKQKFRYQVWGETVDIANQLQQNAKPNTILVTQIVYDRVHEIYDFSKGLVIVQDGYQISTWILGKKELQNFISDDITVGLDFDDDNFTDRKSSQTENNLLG
uniref:adenylate/guanylate cyclase domain-containing protein n=1 Tax=Mastigocoleus sp. MO_188.B34 TaxID=3036635 RepID=UPI00261D4190